MSDRTNNGVTKLRQVGFDKGPFTAVCIGARTRSHRLPLSAIVETRWSQRMSHLPGVWSTKHINIG